MFLDVEDSRNYSRTNLPELQGLDVDVVDYYSSEREDKWLERRYVLQSAVTELLPESRTGMVCYKRPLLLSRPKVVSRLNREGQEYYSYEGLSRCGSVWICPHCSARISESRKKEIEKAVLQWRGERHGKSFPNFKVEQSDYVALSGKELRMILFTVPHQRFDNLDSLLDRFKKAFRWMKKQRSCLALCKEVGLFGTILVLEVTYGSHGWHPHIHALYFFDSSLWEKQEGRWFLDYYFEPQLFSLWSKAVEKFGFGELSRGGYGVKDADFVADYLSKFGRPPKSAWRVEHELSKWFLKSGGFSGLTPFDLLEAHVFEMFSKVVHDHGFSQVPYYSEIFKYYDLAKEKGVSVFELLRGFDCPGGPGALFVEYANAFKGRHQIQWSRGLKKYFSIQEMTDEELVMEPSPQEVVYDIPVEQWNEIVSRGNRYCFLLDLKRGLHQK